MGLFSGLNDPRHSSKPIVSLQIRNDKLEPDFLNYCTSMCTPGVIFKYFATCLQIITIFETWPLGLASLADFKLLYLGEF